MGMDWNWLELFTMGKSLAETLNLQHSKLSIFQDSASAAVNLEILGSDPVAVCMVGTVQVGWWGQSQLFKSIYLCDGS